MLGQHKYEWFINPSEISDINRNLTPDEPQTCGADSCHCTLEATLFSPKDMTAPTFGKGYSKGIGCTAADISSTKLRSKQSCMPQSCGISFLYLKRHGRYGRYVSFRAPSGPVKTLRQRWQETSTGLSVKENGLRVQPSSSIDVCPISSSAQYSIFRKWEAQCKNFGQESAHFTHPLSVPCLLGKRHTIQFFSSERNRSW